jgi:hypothetical protein
MDKKMELLENYLLENDFISDSVLNMITGIYGYKLETLENILYYLTGYNNLEQVQADVLEFL